MVDNKKDYYSISKDKLNDILKKKMKLSLLEFEEGVSLLEEKLYDDEQVKLFLEGCKKIIQERKARVVFNMGLKK